MNLTIDDLLAKTPEQFRPVVTEYGPALIKMTIDEFAAWLKLLIEGKGPEAWAALMAKLDTQQAVLDEWNNLGVAWDKANEANKARMDLQRTAAMAVLKVLLAVMLAAVGL